MGVAFFWERHSELGRGVFDLLVLLTLCVPFGRPALRERATRKAQLRIISVAGLTPPRQLSAPAHRTQGITRVGLRRDSRVVVASHHTAHNAEENRLRAEGPSCPVPIRLAVSFFFEKGTLSLKALESVFLENSGYMYPLNFKLLGHPVTEAFCKKAYIKGI